ncbi:MAG: methyltransferase domain-containing protein [Gammaproteobacteria bacterium]
MALKHSYTLLAPFYDTLVSAPLDSWRQKSLARLQHTNASQILINGIGSGLDIPYLPADADLTGSDITPAMLARAQKRAVEHQRKINLVCTDSQQLSFESETFDIIIMHLILAVVPRPERALQEACRVLKPGGKIYIFDKFLRPGERALARRLLNVFIRHVATRTDVVFETVLSSTPELIVIHDEPALAGGWFRLIELHKQQGTR